MTVARATASPTHLENPESRFRSRLGKRLKHLSANPTDTHAHLDTHPRASHSPHSVSITFHILGPSSLHPRRGWSWLSP